jgi:putative endonuclease
LPRNWHVYIGRLRDHRFYVGISRQASDSLLDDHVSGDHSRYTRAEGLIRIEWTEVHPSLAKAKARERQLKGWSHAKKQALIDGDLKKLKSLAKARKNTDCS